MYTKKIGLRKKNVPVFCFTAELKGKPKSKGCSIKKCKEKFIQKLYYEHEKKCKGRLYMDIVITFLYIRK